jgi:hypothetical protein
MSEERVERVGGALHATGRHLLGHAMVRSSLRLYALIAGDALRDTA